MAFTSWAALKAQMENDIAEIVSGGAWRTRSYEIATGAGSRRLEYRSMEELQAAYEWVCRLAREEEAPFSRRVYARNGGRC